MNKRLLKELIVLDAIILYTKSLMGLYDANTVGRIIPRGNDEEGRGLFLTSVLHGYSSYNLHD